MLGEHRSDLLAGCLSVAVVVILLLSGVPNVVPRAASTARPIPDASVPAKVTPERAASSPATTSAIGARTVPGRSPNRPALCGIGLLQYCATPGAPPAAGVTPSGTGRSSWKDITPPTGSANPANAEEAAVSYYPSGHEVILYGGLGFESGGGFSYLHDTWSFVDNRWTELWDNATCSPTTCPSPRAGAMLAYDPARNALLLFGGETGYDASPFYTSVALNDTWIFANDTWTNISSDLGPAPSPRFEGSMIYDPSDNYILLFGGMTENSNSLGDTWEFSAGRWTNISATVGTAPGSRAAASIASSPSGFVLLYGGALMVDSGVETTIYENNCDGGGGVAYWFDHGKWSALTYPDTNTGLCAPKRPAGESGSAPTAGTDPTPSAATAVANPPCGRVGAALGWSPKNSRFVLFGGYGPDGEAALGACVGGPTALNDTFSYGNAPGGTFSWYNVTDNGDPYPRAYMGYTSDFTDDYFEIFGGIESFLFNNQTWRFYEIVHARLTGPSGIDTAKGLHLETPFVVTGFGGSGLLAYTFAVKGVRNSNSLDTGTGCGPFYAGSKTLPYSGTLNFTCQPDPRSFNIFRITLSVSDQNNSSDRATSNWTFSVLPPEAMDLYSEFVGYFYDGLSLENTFSIYTEVNNGPALSISATLAGHRVDFTQRSGHPKWWDATVQVSSEPRGAILAATAQFGNWTQNTTYALSMITPPSWLQSIFDYSTANLTVTPHGAGSLNRSYTVADSYAWNLGDGLGFNLPIDLLAGSYDMIPSLKVALQVTSVGDLSLVGSLPLSIPSIDIGPASLTMNITLSLTGTFDVVGTGVDWVNASAVIRIDADLSASIPIYGFSILGLTVGFVLDVGINASAALRLILAPTTDSAEEIVHGIGVMIQNFIGSFSVALSAAVDFGIGIASIGLGGSLSVAFTFVTQPDFAIHDGWVNGTIFVTASFLFWSDQWDLASGNIYMWDPPGGGGPAVGGSPDSGYNTTGGAWTIHPRYYNSTGYDATVWDPATTSGPAISDIYPYTSISGATAYTGPYLFYTTDNVSDAPTRGLGFVGEHLNTTTNALSSISAPADPGYVIVSPEATRLSDGDLYVLWDAIPLAEALLASPLDLTSIALQGANFDPATSAWGPIQTFSHGEFAESYLPGSAGRALELLSSAPLIGESTPERLVEYNLTSGAVEANVSVTGVSEITSLRGTTNLTLLELEDGNYSLFDLATGSAVGIAYVPPTGESLISADFVAGTTTTLALLYRGATTSELVLYDTASGKTLGKLALGGSTAEIEGIGSHGTNYLFVRTATGIGSWTESGGTFAALATINESHLESYGLVEAGTSILIYGLLTNGASSDPVKTMVLDEIGATLPAVTGPSASSSGTAPASSSPTDYLLFLEIAAGAAAVLLAAVYIGTHRRPPAATPPPTPGAAAPAPSAASPPPPSPPSG
ncbi:MAG: kelch repeat-containing protein [Thermoplasmata archaeon]